MAKRWHQYFCPDCWVPEREQKYPFVRYSQLQGPEACQNYVFPQSQVKLSSHPVTPTSSLRDSYDLASVGALQPGSAETSLGVRVETQEAPTVIQFSLRFNSEKNVLKVSLQQAYNFETNYPYGQYSISTYLYPNKQPEYVSNIKCYNSSPVFNQVFEFTNWSESNRPQMLIFGVYKHTRCVRRKMVGVIPVDLNSVDLCGKTIQRTIQDSSDDIKHYQNSSSLLRLSDSCACHSTSTTSNKAVAKLIIASVMCLLFTIGEVLGGYFAGSLAIMTDAAHMLSDLAGFLISLLAIWVGSRPPSKRMSFGWHRAEVIGAIISVLIVWVITGILFHEAIQRVLDPNQIEVKPDIMLITACVGVFVNVFMCAVLGHGHGHSHGGEGHGHSHGGHGHSHGGHGRKKQDSSADAEEGNSLLSRFKRRLKRKTKKQESSENINVRAAFVHVIGDLIQSIGVVIAGYIIWIRPDWKLADPICTFLFCVLVLFSTINILKDALRVLMEGTPSHIDYEDVKTNLEAITGVKQAHSLHIWSLTTTKSALSAHLTIEPGVTGVTVQEILDKAIGMLKENHDILHTTLQVEDYNELMNNCDVCQERKKQSFCTVM